MKNIHPVSKLIFWVALLGCMTSAGAIEGLYAVDGVRLTIQYLLIYDKLEPEIAEALLELGTIKTHKTQKAHEKLNK